MLESEWARHYFQTSLIWPKRNKIKRQTWRTEDKNRSFLHVSQLEDYVEGVEWGSRDKGIETAQLTSLQEFMFLLLVMAGLLCLCLFACMDHKMMNCRFSSHTYRTVLLFKKTKNKISLRTWRIMLLISRLGDSWNGQIWWIILMSIWIFFFFFHVGGDHCRKIPTPPHEATAETKWSESNLSGRDCWDLLETAKILHKLLQKTL